MKIKCVQVFLIGCGFLTSCIAQVNIQRKLWCDGVEANTYIRNVTDCRVWIRCNGPESSPSSGICPNPSYFSAELQKCTSEKAANCFVCPDATSTTFHSVANSCSRFIRCDDGVASEMSCGIGMGFNPETNRCEPGFYRTCSSKTTVQPADPSTLSTDTYTTIISPTDELTEEIPTDEASTPTDATSEETPTDETSTSTDATSEETPTDETSTPTDAPSEETPSAATSTTSIPVTVTPWNPITLVTSI